MVPVAARMILLLVAALAMSGCWWLIDNRNPDPAIEISNRTDKKLWFFSQTGEEDVMLAGSPLRPGATGRFQAVEEALAQECTAGPVIARDADDKVIARRAQPLCQGDSWVVRE